MSVHVMLDLETWGTAPGCALRSIGACTFDPYADPDAPYEGHDFYANIERESCEAYGLTVDPETVEWWERQSQAARDSFLTHPQPIRLVVNEFREWWLRFEAVYLWSNGAIFDEPIWRAASRAVGTEVPWEFSNVRDTRTIWHAARVNPKTIPRDGRDGVPHNAYADARHQAKCVTLAYRNLQLSRIAPSPEIA